MFEERKQWQNPQTILNEAGVTKGMIIADLGSEPGFFTIPMALTTGEKGLVYAVDSSQTMLNGLKENIAKSEVNPNIIKRVSVRYGKLAVQKRHRLIRSLNFILFKRKELK
jgi:tRNA A58 N-methylase Trm61